MALNLPTFYKRTGSAIVFAIIMLGGLLWNNWAFLGLMFIIQALCYREFVLLMKKIYPDAFWPDWLAISFSLFGVVLMLPISSAIYFVHSRGTSMALIDFLQMKGQFIGLLLVLPAVYFLLALLSKKQFLTALTLSILGLFYITLPFACLVFMHATGRLLPLVLILMIWSNDTLAYLVGSFIGKTPFSPISPKKTWEGTAGGAILTMAGAAAYGYFSGRFNIVDCIMLALCATVAGTLGDLVESKLKRMADVKDSGAIMPGHGGALDRFDSLLLAAPFAGAYVYYFM